MVDKKLSQNGYTNIKGYIFFFKKVTHS